MHKHLNICIYMYGCIHIYICAYMCVILCRHLNIERCTHACNFIITTTNNTIIDLTSTTTQSFRCERNVSTIAKKRNRDSNMNSKLLTNLSCVLIFNTRSLYSTARERVILYTCACMHTYTRKHITIHSGILSLIFIHLYKYLHQESCCVLLLFCFSSFRHCQIK
uniref:Uncharacterized protein n=1 Tax=Glossina brevipalpis TaxID=37001 RepID=A0A1A9WJP4_9MUSC